MLKTILSKHIQPAAALALTAALLLGAAADYAANCRAVRTQVLRLHVTANSDSPADQAVKLLVRDAILEAGADAFTGASSAAQAAERLEPALHTLERTAQRVLRENGCVYEARATLVNEYFSTRSYGYVTLPAGRYAALRITLGSGEGKNWWCVMFPPLCLPAAEKREAEGDVYAVWNGSGAAVVRPENGYEIRFRIVELAQEIWHKITEK